MVSSAVSLSSRRRSSRRHGGSPLFCARFLARSRSLFTWSRSTSASSTVGSSFSSPSNSSDSAFSLMAHQPCSDLLCGFWRTRITGSTHRDKLSMDQLIHLENGQEHCKNNAHDEQSHEHDQAGAQQPDN